MTRAWKLPWWVLAGATFGGCGFILVSRANSPLEAMIAAARAGIPCRSVSPWRWDNVVLGLRWVAAGAVSGALVWLLASGLRRVASADRDEVEAARRRHFDLGLVIIASLVALALRLALWEIVSRFSVFAMFIPPILGILLLLVAAAFAFRSVTAYRDFKPLIVVGLAAALYAFFPFTDAYLLLRWQLMHSRMERVVEMVQRHELTPNERGVAKLPAGYESLSTGGGDIFIDSDHGDDRPVLFLTFRGILRHFSGFAYLPNDRFDGELHCRAAQQKRLAPKWFFLSCH